MNGPGDQNHARTAASRSLRQRVSHLSGRAIADVSNRIDRLERGAGRDQNRFAFEISFQRMLAAIRTQTRRIRQSVRDSEDAPLRRFRKPANRYQGRDMIAARNATFAGWLR